MAAPWRVDITASAERLLRKLDPQAQRRVASLIDRLAADPRPHGCLKLAGTKNLWRVRSGDYRVIYTIADAKLLVLVVTLGLRDDIYDGM